MIVSEEYKYNLKKEVWVHYNYQQWLTHFKENDKARLQIDFSEEPILTHEQRKLIFKSIKAFQMGEHSDGVYLTELAERFGKEYHDRILMHQGQLAHMARYIQDNPRRLAMKRARPDLFRIRQNIRFGHMSCVAMGNIFLAEYPQREVLQCSRRLTQTEIDAKCEECLKGAANGTVYISGAISEGEKQISRALREAGYPLIILLTEGFPEPDSPHYQFFKPQGVYFEACAAGKLLLIQPDKEVLERPDIEEAVTAKVGNIPHESQRYRFVAINTIAEKIAGE